MAPRYLLLGMIALMAACVALCYAMTSVGMLGKYSVTIGVNHRHDQAGKICNNTEPPIGTDTFHRVNLSDAGSPVISLQCDCGSNGENRTANAAIRRSDSSRTVAPHQSQIRISESTPGAAGKATEPLGTNVAILASMRTGSSFIGKLFGQRDDFFYLYEPGLALQTKLKSGGALFIQPLYIELLKSLYRCNTTGHAFYMDWLSWEDQNGVLTKAPQLYDVCPGFKRKRRAHNCGTIPAEVFTPTCREKRNIAIKIIRIWDIGLLLPMIQNSEVNLKVIHLVRDPRGMIASRNVAMHNATLRWSSLTKDDEMLEYLMSFCSCSTDNKEVGYNLPMYRDNYFLLRYEDMSLDPKGTAQRIYNFTGLGTIPENISEWIAKNTHSGVPGVYSTARVSSKAYQSWRTSLDFETVKAIEQVRHCAQMMQHFGYLPVQDELHLKNMSSSLVTQVPPPFNFEKYQL